MIISREDFNDYLKTLETIEDQLVYMRYKYSWETNWTYAKELLLVDTDESEYYAWLNDWFEGQQDIEILGCIPITEIDVPLFETNTAKKE